MTVDVIPVLLQFWLGMLAHLWQTTLILCFLFLITLGMKQAPARLTRMVWIAGLVKLFLPLALGGAAMQVIGNHLLRGIAPNDTAVSIPTLKVVAAVLDVPRGMVLGERMRWVASPAVIVGGTAIWFLCAAFLLARLWRDMRRSRTHNVLSPSQMEPFAKRKLNHVLTRLGLGHSAVRVCNNPTMPSVAGIIRPRILVPRRLIDVLTHNELEAILAHERAHQRRFDPFWALLQRLCSAILFFYPLLPFLLRRLNESFEFACDEEVAACGLSSKTYGSALNRSLRIGLEPLRLSSTVIRGNESLLSRRLERIATPGRFKMSLKYRLCIVLAAFLVMGSSFLPFPLRAETEEGVGKAPSEVSDELPMIDEHVEYDTPPEVKEFMPPRYPEKAKKEGITGTVVAKLLIDTMGVVRDLRIVEGPEVFHESVEEAGYKTKFTPAKRDNEAVAVWVALPIKFALDEK